MKTRIDVYKQGCVQLSGRTLSPLQPPTERSRNTVLWPRWLSFVDIMAAPPAVRDALLLLANELAEDPLLDAAELLVAREEEALLREEEEREERVPRQGEEGEERPPSPVRVKDYAEVIVPMYSGEDFKKHFRLQRETFEDLCRMLAPHLSARIHPVSKKVLVTLWLLGNLESFRGVADRFDLGKSSLHSILCEVCNALTAIRGNIIIWPTRDQLPQLAQDFLRRTNMPGVIGAIDGTHIPIPGPSQERHAYINRKGFPSIQLQAVCDANLKFTDILTGWPGSVHDARVFRNSPLHTILENGNLPEEYHLLGDSAYTLQPYMIVPYRDNGHLPPWQVNFNHIHSTSRVVIERAFGLLKSKFRRLLKLEMYDLEKIPLVISSACVIHNIILMQENLNLDLELQDLEVIRQHDIGGDDAPRLGRAAAVEKRDEIALGLARHI